MRKLTTILFAVCALSISLAACASKPPPKATGKMMTGEEIAAWYMSGNQTETAGKSVGTGNAWVISRNGNGEQSISSNNGNFTDKGTYRIDGDILCTKWVKIRNGAEACTTLHVLPDGTYEAANEKGERIATFTAPTVK